MHEKVQKFIDNPKKAFFTLSIPIAIGMFVQTLYNIVDTAFIGRLGSNAIAALTFSFPLFFILIAINSGINAGSGSRISRYLGEKNYEAAENTAMHGVFLSMVCAVIVFILGELTIKQTLTLFGAEGEVLKLGIEFMSIIFFGFLFMFPTFSFSGIFSAQGEAKLPMKIQVFSLIINIILDPILIYKMNLGVKGAAIATLIATIFSFILFLYFIHTKSHLKLKWKEFKYSKKIMKDIISVGAPATLMMLLLSVYVIFINKYMMHYGTDHVAMFGLISRLEGLAIIPIVAFSLSMITLIGMFHGAKKFDLIKEISYYGIKMITYFTIGAALILFMFPKIFLKIFTTDPAIIALGIPYLRLDVLTFPFMGITMMISRIMQGMGHGKPGLVINFIRAIGIAVPLSYLFVYYFDYGYLSIAVAMIIGGIVSTIAGLIWLNSHLKIHHKEDTIE